MEWNVVPFAAVPCEGFQNSVQIAHCNQLPFIH